MKVVLIHNARFPVTGYGGTERVIWWLAKGLSARGHEVILACEPGSACPFGAVEPLNFGLPLAPQFSQSVKDADIHHYFNTPSNEPERPYVVTIEGNGQIGETYLANTAFVSRNHAERHGAECFVYNGLDPQEYRFEGAKSDYFIFLAKASWRVKNVKGAIRLARSRKVPLHILGGTRRWLPHWRGIHWEGILDGQKKADWIAGAKALLFPILWNEPFGLAVIEALVSGTPVIATRRGSMPELVTSEVGRLCDTESDFLTAIDQIQSVSSERCRQWVWDHFHYQKMADAYVGLYERVMNGERLNQQTPRATDPPQKLMPLFD